MTRNQQVDGHSLSGLSFKFCVLNDNDIVEIF